MRVLVCGGRHFVNEDTIRGALNDFNSSRGPIAHLIHGNAYGADQLAAKVAKSMNIEVTAYPADWDKYGKRAGPMRNAQMLSEGKPNVVIAFEGGIGTADMCNKAARAGVEIINVQ